jgi:hypothetical protein
LINDSIPPDTLSAIAIAWPSGGATRLEKLASRLTAKRRSLAPLRAPAHHGRFDLPAHGLREQGPRAQPRQCGGGLTAFEVLAQDVPEVIGRAADIFLHGHAGQHPPLQQRGKGIRGRHAPQNRVDLVPERLGAEPVPQSASTRGRSASGIQN